MLRGDLGASGTDLGETHIGLGSLRGSSWAALGTSRVALGWSWTALVIVVRTCGLWAFGDDLGSFLKVSRS